MCLQSRRVNHTRGSHPPKTEMLVRYIMYFEHLNIIFIYLDILRVALYFSEPRRGKEKYEQWAKCPLVLYAKPSNKRFIIPLQKRKYLAIGFYFLVRVFRDILMLFVRMTLTISKMFTRIICQTIEWEVNYFTAREKWYFGFYFLMTVSKTSGFCQPQLRLLHPPVFALL